MELKIIKMKKGEIEIDSDDKSLPNVLREALIEEGVDAYTYEPQPLLSVYRLHITSKNPPKDLEMAIDKVEKNLSELRGLFESELKV